MRRFIVWMLVLMMMCVSSTAGAEGALSDDIVILYTNDVHTYIDGPISYDVIAAVKEHLQQEYRHVLLLDAGDHIQGTAYGSMDEGESIIRLMNAAGYDAATLGNHEFDYGMDGCIAVREWAEYPYVVCNFYHEEDYIRNDNVFPSYVIFDCGQRQVAVVGISTPESFTKTSPTYFQDETGAYIYGMSGGEDGAALYADVQDAIDAAKAEGADSVIALAHLGVDASSGPWTSRNTIANTCGLDALIDGHSHTVIEGERLLGKDGCEVVLTQTGEYFDRIGMMIIDAETGEITTDFIESVELTETAVNAEGEMEEIITGYELSSEIYDGTALVSDTETAAIKDAWIASIDEQLGKVIGSCAVTLDNYTPEGDRLVRKQETNSGDFTADALYFLFDDIGLDVDVAVMNGGGIRNRAVTGEMTYKTCKEIHTFGNVACLQTITGQQLLDALEWGARYVGTEMEEGSFLHVSGVKYKINTAYPNTTIADDMDIWVDGPTGGYRVQDVQVFNKETNAWDALDLTANYNLAGYNYTLRDLGGGFAMFNGAVNVLDYVMEDYMVLANYVQAFENCEVQATNSPLMKKYPGMHIDYSSVNGDGRITEICAE